MRTGLGILALCCVACAPPTVGSAAPPPNEAAPPSTATQDATPTPKSTTRDPGPPVGGVDALPRLVGMSEIDLVAELGEPTQRREFAMRDCCTEFQIELLNTYHPGEGHDDVLIREWTWDYDGYALTVWLHAPAGRWDVLRTIRYADDVEF